MKKLLIPFVLIICILVVILLINGMKKNGKDSVDELQKDIMEYADANQSAEALSQANASFPASLAQPEQEEEKTENLPTSAPSEGVMETGKKDYSKVKFDKEAQLKEMMAYWADNNQKALDDLANLERFIAMSWQLKGSADFYYYGEKNDNGRPEGKGIAVYADNQYYYGDWKDGVRSGNGTWIHYHIHQAEEVKDICLYHQYSGGWADDLPDGEGAEHYDYNLSLLEERTGYDANRIGSYSRGLVHGEFYITNIYSDESTKEWNAKAEHGSWIYQNENKDPKGNRTVYIEINDPENYIWMHPKKNINIGVPCFISKNKN